MTFIEVLSHYRGTDNFDELSGLKSFENYLNELKMNKYKDEYKIIMKFHLMPSTSVGCCYCSGVHPSFGRLWLHTHGR